MAVFIRRLGSPTPRNTFSEWFVIDEGKIRYLWAAMFYPLQRWPFRTGRRMKATFRFPRRSCPRRPRRRPRDEAGRQVSSGDASFGGGWRLPRIGAFHVPYSFEYWQIAVFFLQTPPRSFLSCQQVVIAKTVLTSGATPGQTRTPGDDH